MFVKPSHPQVPSYATADVAGLLLSQVCLSSQSTLGNKHLSQCTLGGWLTKQDGAVCPQEVIYTSKMYY